MASSVACRTCLSARSRHGTILLGLVPVGLASQGGHRNDGSPGSLSWRKTQGGKSVKQSLPW